MSIQPGKSAIKTGTEADKLEKGKKVSFFTFTTFNCYKMEDVGNVVFDN